MFAKVAVDYRLAECTVCYVLQSCLLCTYRQYFSQSLLSLPTAAANDIHKFCALHLWKPLSATLLLYTKRSKYLQLISLQESSGTDLSTFCLFLCSPFFYPPLLSSPKALLSGPRNLAHSEKHSWKAFSPPDQGGAGCQTEGREDTSRPGKNQRGTGQKARDQGPHVRRELQDHDGG